MTLRSTSDPSSILENGKLKPGIYKIQNIQSEASASRGKSDITLQCLVIEALPLQGLITNYNGL